MTDQRLLRARLRAQRRGLSRAQQRAAAQALVRNSQVQRLLRGRRRIAVYLANDGEVDLVPLIERLWRNGQSAYLPVLPPHRGRRMGFARYRPDSLMVANRFGIAEPQCSPHASLAGTLRAAELDLILMPLVGFDDAGNRLGMGGGFYDRTLAFLRRRQRWQRPLLIGVAHELQRVPVLAPRRWDVPLDGVITDGGVERFRRGV